MVGTRPQSSLETDWTRGGANPVPDALMPAKQPGTTESSSLMKSNSLMISTIQNESIAPPSLEALEFRLYSDLSAIAGISREWDSLLAASRCNRAFGSPEWYLGSCRVHSSLKPYVAVAACGPELVCILPLALDPANGTATFPHRENDYNDILIRGDHPGPAAGLLEYAMSPKTPCRRMILSKLKPDSDSIRAAALLDGRSNIVCDT